MITTAPRLDTFTMPDAATKHEAHDPTAVLAEARGIGAAEMAAATTANALRIFSKMPPLAA